MAEKNKTTRANAAKPKASPKQPLSVKSAPQPQIAPSRTTYFGADTKGGVIPQPVVKVYSSRGLEYLFMVISLVVLTFGVATLGADIIAYLFDSESVANDLSQWTSLEAITIVGAGVFFYLWSRLRAAETVSPSVLRDGSRKRALQKGIILGFLVLLIVGFGFVYTIIDALTYGSDIGSEQWMNLLSVSYVLAVVGTAFSFLLTQERKGE